MKKVVQKVLRFLLSHSMTLPVPFVGHSFYHEPATVDFRKNWFEKAQLVKSYELCLSFPSLLQFFSGRSFHCLWFSYFNSAKVHVGDLITRPQQDLLHRGPPR